jgi:ATP-dependent Clp protease ATP-binding subunit ClpC
MPAALCSRCKKNLAVIFITKLEGGRHVNEGLCLSCAHELNIKPVEDLISKMGLSDDDINNISKEMTNAFSAAESNDIPYDDGSLDEEGKTATFPFMNKLFGAMSRPAENEDIPGTGQDAPKRDDAEKRAANPKRKFLNNYCINLSEKARLGQLDRLIGREEELERVLQILNRRQKNNPCLIGEPGVGKTAIAEGLAQAISEGRVPYKLLDKEVYLLDLTALVAGTQFRGQFESRMKGLIEEIKSVGNVILVIDEVHSIVGAGDAEGSMNAANILKPALSRGEIQVIGATTFTEYRKHIEKDAALERRFQPVTVPEPSIEESIEILSGIAHYYEDAHSVKIGPEVIRQAVLMSERYITDRYLPDKAIDLIDEACSDVNLKDKTLNRIAEIEKEVKDLELERELLLSDTKEDDFERLAFIRSSLLKLNDELNILKSELPELTVDNLARVIELWTKIPASSIKEDEFIKLTNLGDQLREHIVGQDEAIDTVTASIKRSRVGLQAKRKPVSFIFVGGTGVGKTELVKRLAEKLFSSPENLIRLDMSEYMEKFSVSRLIGSPPGYVGYDEAGQLTEKIRRKPYSVVLFDEIEKAHPDVMNILLQILDDGRITDSQGRTVNFENAIIIMTTNAGSNTRGSAMGFGASAEQQNREKQLKALKEFLRPEFINRVDEIVYFNSLTEENFKAIADLMLNEVKDLLSERNINLIWNEDVLEYLIKKSYSETYGARNLRRVIQKEVEDKIASLLVDELRGAADEISLSSEGEIITVKAR